jgi:hypothetical protein
LRRPAANRAIAAIFYARAGHKRISALSLARARLRRAGLPGKASHCQQVKRQENSLRIYADYADFPRAGADFSFQNCRSKTFLIRENL